MKKQSLYLLFLLLLIHTPHTTFCMGAIQDILAPQKQKPDILVPVGPIEQKKKQLADLQKEKTELDEKTTIFTENINKRTSKIIRNINNVNAELNKKPDQVEFLTNQRDILNDTYQELKDITSSREQLLESINEHIKIIENYLTDTNLSTYLNEYRDSRKFYTFDDLQSLNDIKSNQEKKIQSLLERLKNAQIELENIKQTAENTTEEYEIIKRKRETFRDDPETVSLPEMFIFTNEQKLELLNLKENLYKTKKELDAIKINKTKQKISLLDTNIELDKKKLDIITKTINDIEPYIKIKESDLSAEKNKLKQKQTESINLRERDDRKIRKIAIDYDAKNKQLEAFSKQLNVPITSKIKEWDIEPESISDYTNLLKVGSAHEFLLLLDAQKSRIKVEMTQSDEELSEQEVQIEVKSTFFKINTGKFATKEQIRKEIKKYDQLKNDINGKIANYNSEISALSEILNIKTLALDNIKKIGEKLQSERNRLFKARIKNYSDCMLWLNNAIEMISSQIKLHKETIQIYNKIISTNIKKLKLVELILVKLKKLGLQHRPAYAIKWEEVQNIAPDINRFFTDLSTYITMQLSLSGLIEQIKVKFPQKIDLIILLIKILITLGVLIIFKVYAPKINLKLYNIPPTHKIMRTVGLIIAFIIEFTLKYFVLISMWILLFISFKLKLIPDDYLYSLFCLISIPYVLYLANRLLNYLISFNEKQDYLFISRTFRRRFFLVTSILLYSTIIIQFFRKAFISGFYYKSELPTILLALNFIILQISLINLLAKEQILNIIPTKNKTWRWIHQQASQFYFLILAVVVAIIVMSNPYVGFIDLVQDILYRSFITVPLIVGLFMLHSFIKKASLKIFFATEEEVVRERFNYGKTLYGLSIILAFTLIAIIGLVIVAQIWGWEKINFTSISTWLKTTGFGEKGKEITFISVFKLIGVIFSGFILAYAVNRFVLKKIFELIPVDSGAQYAVTSILKYLIITTSVAIGFYYINLGGVIGYAVGALVFSIGLILKEPLSDFVYYFLILVQRPLKIGDYITVDEETAGVVRKITPKSTILRKKNSESVLVPNSYILSKPVTNWNYTTGFVAFNDILIKIDYRENPKEVKTVLYNVLDQHPNILKSPRPTIRLEDFDKYGFQFLVRGYISTHYVLDMWDIASDIRFAIVEELRKNNIKIAIPVRITLDESLDKIQES